MPVLDRDIQAVAQRISEAQTVCIISHMRPDADAIGSATALSLALSQLGKSTTMVIGQLRPFSPNLLSIPESENIQCVETLPRGFDLYVTVDCGSLDRTGTFASDLSTMDNVVCIDHHASNKGFGAVNLVSVESESTTVVLTQIFDAMGISLNRDLAHCLYAGLLTDTGSFRWGRPKMHEFAQRFVSYGLNTKQIAGDLIDSATQEDLRMIGRVLAQLRIVSAGEHTLGVLAASLELTEEASESAVESLVDFVRALDGTDIGVNFKEQTPGEWAVSLRSTDVDCARIAVSLGGGGHVPAAGYTAHGTKEEILEQLVRAIETL